MMWKRLLVAATFAGLTSFSLGATTLGTFNLGGDIFVNGTSAITWTDNNGVADMATLSDATGIYAGLDGQEVSIENLNSSTEPTGTSFSDDLYIVFNPADHLQSLEINMIYAGVDGVADCGLNPSVVTPPQPQVCTPPLANGGVSPFNFENNPPPNNITSTASYSISGDVANSPGDTWFANFTSQFNVPFQTVLAELGPSQNQTVTDSYSSTFTVSSTTASPETGTIFMFGLGLGFILIARSSGLISRLRRQ